jgi:hypothetical protein
MKNKEQLAVQTNRTNSNATAVVVVQQGEDDD